MLFSRHCYRGYRNWLETITTSKAGFTCTISPVVSSNILHLWAMCSTAFACPLVNDQHHSYCKILIHRSSTIAYIKVQRPTGSVAIPFSLALSTILSRSQRYILHHEGRTSSNDQNHVSLQIPLSAIVNSPPNNSITSTLSKMAMPQWGSKSMLNRMTSS